MASTSSRSALALSLQQVYDIHSRAGRLGSGSTIVAAVAKMERATNLLVTELVSRAAGVSRTPAAFEEVASGMRRWLRACEDELEEVVRQSLTVSLHDSGSLTSDLCQRELQRLRDGLDQRLKVERYGFETSDEVVNDRRPQLKARIGGRPPAEFWDDMWAAIAAQLYDGSLHPKTQADVERAMAEWITANGHDAASSTVRARARRLADKLEL